MFVKWVQVYCNKAFERIVGTTHVKASLVPIMARYPSIHYLNQWWPWFTTSYGVTGPKWIKQYDKLMLLTHEVPDSKVNGANTGPTWGRQDPVGPHVGHINLVIWGASKLIRWYLIFCRLCIISNHYFNIMVVNLHSHVYIYIIIIDIWYRLRISAYLIFTSRIFFKLT